MLTIATLMLANLASGEWTVLSVAAEKEMAAMENRRGPRCLGTGTVPTKRMLAIHITSATLMPTNLASTEWTVPPVAAEREMAAVENKWGPGLPQHRSDDPRIHGYFGKNGRSIHGCLGKKGRSILDIFLSGLGGRRRGGAEWWRRRGRFGR